MYHKIVQIDASQIGSGGFKHEFGRLMSSLKEGLIILTF